MSPGPDFPIYVGVSHSREDDEGNRVDPTLQDALEDLWRNAEGESLHVLEIELHGSNPIDMFRVIGTSH